MPRIPSSTHRPSDFPSGKEPSKPLRKDVSIVKKTVDPLFNNVQHTKIGRHKWTTAAPKSVDVTAVQACWKNSHSRKRK